MHKDWRPGPVDKIILAKGEPITMEQIEMHFCSDIELDHEVHTRPRTFKLVAVHLDKGIEVDSITKNVAEFAGEHYIRSRDEIVVFGGGFAPSDHFKQVLGNWMDVSPSMVQLTLWDHI